VNDQILIGLNRPNLKNNGRHRGDHSAFSKYSVPLFTPPTAVIRPRFCGQLVKNVRILTSGSDFTWMVFCARAVGKLKRMPRKERLTSMGVLLEWLCFYYDPVTNSVQRSPREMVKECAFTSRRQARQALQTLEDIEYILRGSNADGSLHIYFTPALFEALKIRPDHLRAARLKAERVQRQRGTPL
jgi:incFII family plasmid replication initiator RepA